MSVMKSFCSWIVQAQQLPAGEPGSGMCCVPSRLAREPRRCHQGRRWPLAPRGTAGLALQELCHLICSGKWHWELWNPLGRVSAPAKRRHKAGWVWLSRRWALVVSGTEMSTRAQCNREFCCAPGLKQPRGWFRKGTALIAEELEPNLIKLN